MRVLERNPRAELPPARESLLPSMNPDQQDRLDATLKKIRRFDGIAATEWGLLEGLCPEHMGGRPQHAPDLPPMKHEGSCAAGQKEDPRAYGKEVERQIRAVEEASRFLDGPDHFAEIEETGGNALALEALAQQIADALRGRDAALGVIRSPRVVWRGRGLLGRLHRSESPAGSPHPPRSRRVKRRSCAAFRAGQLSLEIRRLLVCDRAANKPGVEETMHRVERIPVQKLGQERDKLEERQNRALGLRMTWGPTRQEDHLGRNRDGTIGCESGERRERARMLAQPGVERVRNVPPCTEAVPG